ncbi:hypothetical protein BKG96_04660 [Rodentibacter caecimuris]|uniref:HEPN AbiU2-like domain-containing protein n=1 Tax=Rodentibacter caecimuris TaxID=1796644 RepID=A0A1V3KMD9_9PAST|nr:hypothetical protein [Rodentibacter heylii]OOF78837.1 hypothetical protein BKG96_04660 [Rodentibacter heylii]
MKKRLLFSDAVQISYSRLKMANYYFQEQREIAKQRDTDDGKIYREYRSLPFIKKAYFEQAVIILCTLFEKTNPVSLLRLRESLDKEGIPVQKFDDDFKDFERIYNGLKTIRDKSIAHFESSDIEQFYSAANITSSDIDSLFLALLSYLKYLVRLSGVHLGYELTFSYNADYEIKQIYSKLK